MKCRACTRASVKGSTYCKDHTPPEFRQGKGGSCSAYRKYIERMFLRQSKIGKAS